MLRDVVSLIVGDVQAERVVPKRGPVAWLTMFVAAAMAFLAVFVIAVSLNMQHVSQAWVADLNAASTLSLPATASEDDISAVLLAVETAPGVAGVRLLDRADQQALLAPWFGPDVPLADLPLPTLIEITPAPEGYDAAVLTALIAAAAPDAVLDDHAGWRVPLVQAADRLRWISRGVVVLIAAVLVAVVMIAATAALAANTQVIAVLRRVGATDAYITRAFVRRFTLRALAGGALGMALGYLVTLMIPAAEVGGLPWLGLRLPGASAVALLLIPLTCAVAAFWATRHATRRMLEETP